MSDETVILEIERAIQYDQLDLNGWESDFLESIKRRVQSGRPLSDLQDDVLMKIHKRIG